MRRWLLTLLALLAMDSLLAVDREIFFTAATPSLPAFTWDQQRRLHVGRVTLSLDDNEAAILDMAGGWAQGRLVPVWKTDAQGRYLTSTGLITTDPTQYVFLKYMVDWLGVSLRNPDGSWNSLVLLAPDSTVRSQPFVFTVGTGLKVGEIYWYDGSTVNIIDITDQTAFKTPSDAQQFKRPDLLVPSYGLYRAQTNRYATGADAPDFGIERTATRTLTAGQYAGGIMGVVTTDKVGYVFHGADCLVDGQTNPDPYILEGTQQAIPSASVLPDGSISWTISIFGNERKIYSCTSNKSRSGNELTGTVLTQWQAYQQSTADVLSVTDKPADRTTVGGQDVTDLHNSVITSRQGDVTGQDDMAALQAAMANGEYLRADGNGGLTTVENGTYADAGLESLRMGIATGMTDTIAMETQGQNNLLQQIAPVAQEPQAQDQLAMVDAIASVEAEMYKQTPSSLPLSRQYPHRYAEMLPAGWLPSYLQGNPSPGDGTNPVNPFPPGVQTGAPSYDLNGDGSLDRFGTSDPYQNGIDQVVLKWNVGARQFRLGDYPDCMTQCGFAVYGQNHAKPLERKLLFAGYDGTIWVERRDKWRGINYYSFALASLLEGTAEANVYHFGLKYQGATPVSVKPSPPAPPTSNTVTWQTMSPVIMANGQSMNVITETGVETVYLWSDLGDQASLINGAFSDPTFIPRATNGRPTMCAKYVRTSTPYIVSGTSSTPGVTVTKTVFFPNEFRDDQIVRDTEPVVGTYDNSFMWNYYRPDGMPFNYARGKNFASGQVAVVLNTNDVLARFGGQFPLQSANSLVESGGVDFRVRWTPDGVNPLAADNILAYMNGERTFDIIDGAGYYLFKGKWIAVSSGDAQKALLRQMWEWDMYQPKTVFTVLYCDNDPSKPLLSTARAPVAASARDLYDPSTGVLNQDLRQTTGANLNVNAVRRNQLLNNYWFVFSAAKGREHEVEMALRTPKETKLLCCEWDNFNEVQTKFAGYNIEFFFSDEVERKFVGEVNTKIYGKTNLEGRTTAGGTPSTTVTGENGVADLALANPGSYIFTDNDLLYGKPCNLLKTCALLDDLQYGDPKPNQWVSNLKMQIRHPMVLYYDDRWSAVIAAYGFNADPRQWCAAWDKYSKPIPGAGTDLCKVEFENYATQTTLKDLYNRMHLDTYLDAKKGDIVLPTRPTTVNQPIMPQPPQPWTGGAINYPTPVGNPGLAPVEPTQPVWTRTKAGWGNSYGGTAGSNISNIIAWGNIYPISVPLQAAHDAWLSQIPLGVDPGPEPVVYSWDNYYPSYTFQGGIIQAYLNNYGGWMGGYFVIAGHGFFCNHSDTFYIPDVFPNIALPSYAIAQDTWSPNGDKGFGWGMVPATITRSNGQIACTAYWSETNSYFQTTGMKLVLLKILHDLYWMPAKANYGGYPYAKAAADADLAAYSNYQTRYTQWVQDRARYDQYLQDKAAADQKKAAYDAWLADFTIKEQKYLSDMAAYQTALAAYNQFVQDDAAWVAMYQAKAPLITAWQSYIHSRDSWVYLVLNRAAEPGVDWTNDEPIGQGYMFWRTQTECTCQ